MPKQISLFQIDKILKSVMHPRLEGHNIVDLKMIDKVTLDASRDTIDLALPSLETSLNQQLTNEIRKSIRCVRREPKSRKRHDHKLQGHEGARSDLRKG